MYNSHMSSSWYIEFEWDLRKAEANERKHGVKFEEAATVFDDPWGILIDDEGHSGSEERFVLLGMSLAARCLVVSHCERSGRIVRIISARKATRSEETTYWRGRE